MDGIVLLAKGPGITSFTSLNNVKKALNTTKVGHTGTLDSFAQGLLVVCTGRYTRLAGNITEFDKTYKAVIKFGEETDTLEYTGNVVKTGQLPDEHTVKAAIKSFEGIQMQTPPAFSAIHVDGKRASDVARKGKIVEIPQRQIHVYKADLQDLLLNNDNKVIAALVEFSVSKGTYIRSLARDLGYKCNSCAHLAGLYRTKVGNFHIEEAAGFSLLQDFSIANELKRAEEYKFQKENSEETVIEKKAKKRTPYIPTEEDNIIKKEIIEKIKDFDEATSGVAGFKNIHIYDLESEDNFYHGKPMKKRFFKEHIDSIFLEQKTEVQTLAVFDTKNKFAGLIDLKENRLSYRFVNN